MNSGDGQRLMDVAWLREWFAVGLVGFNQQIENFAAITSGFLVRLAMCAIAGKVWQRDEECLIFVGPFNQHAVFWGHDIALSWRIFFGMIDRGRL